VVFGAVAVPLGVDPVVIPGEAVAAVVPWVTYSGQPRPGDYLDSLGSVAPFENPEMMVLEIGSAVGFLLDHLGLALVTAVMNHLIPGRLLAVETSPRLALDLAALEGKRISDMTQ
jgi:hypothetical protein